MVFEHDLSNKNVKKMDIMGCWAKRPKLAVFPMENVCKSLHGRRQDQIFSEFSEVLNYAYLVATLYYKLFEKCF